MISINKLVTNSIVITTGTAYHADTWYKYSGDTEWRTVSITGQISDSSIPDVYNVVALEIGSNVTSIGDWAFSGCGALTSVTIPDRVTSIGGSAFFDCSGLTSVTIGSNVESIGNSAFQNCSSIASLTIPDSVTSIGSQAFYNCTNLMSITFLGKTKSTVYDMDNYSWDRLGTGCVFHCTDGDITV